AVAGGLAFATVLTLVLTPCLLMLGREHRSVKEDDGVEEELIDDVHTDIPPAASSESGKVVGL
ncbi:hypothetical protein CRN58_28575, partial [Vibrio vulnificus]